MNYATFPAAGLTIKAGQQIAIGSGALALTANGVLQLTDANKNILWSSGGASIANCITCDATFQNDGNLVIYGPNGATWSTATYNNNSGYLTVSLQAPYLMVMNSNFGIVYTSNAAVTGTPAKSVQSFLSSLGVNSHMDQYEGNVTVLLQKLEYLGVGRIRDHYNSGNSTLVSNYRTLAANGVHFDMINYSDDIPTLISDATALNATGAGALESVESLNEINNFSFSYNGSVWAGGWPNNNGPAAAAFQIAYDSALRSTAVLNNIPMFDLTAGNSTNNAASYGLLDIKGMADYGNIHPYPSATAQPRGTLISELKYVYTDVIPFHAIATETGYRTNYVPTDVQAIGNVNIYLDAFSLGYKKTYIYDLTDSGSEFYGLFDYGTNNPKPAATAIHNLTTILADSATAIGTPGNLNLTLTGLPSSAYSLLLQKSNGTYELIIWNEAPIWNGSRLTVAPTSVQVAFGKTVSSASVYNPFVSTVASAHATATSSVAVSLADQALVIEIMP